MYQRRAKRTYLLSPFSLIPYDFIVPRQSSQLGITCLYLSVGFPNVPVLPAPHSARASATRSSPARPSAHRLYNRRYRDSPCPPIRLPILASSPPSARGRDRPAADPAVLELLSNPDASITMFLPIDAAWTAALSTLGLTAEELLANTDLLTEILMYHIVPGVFTLDSLAPLNRTAPLAPFVLLGTRAYENALAISYGDDGRLMINDAPLAVDFMTSNGPIYGIGTVFLPTIAVMDEAMDPMATEEPMMEMPGNLLEVLTATAGAEAPKFTFLLAALQAANPAILATLTGGAGPYTVFALTAAAYTAVTQSQIDEVPTGYRAGETAEEYLADTNRSGTAGILIDKIIIGHFSAETLSAVRAIASKLIRP